MSQGKSTRHTPTCDEGKATTGQCPGCAEDSVIAIFENLSKKRQADLLGDYNEVLCFIAKAEQA